MSQHNLLASITRPGRYLGEEFNATIKDWNSVNVRFALVFPDLYEIGMSHQGLQILYHILNAKENFLAERCYCPGLDVEKLLRQTGEPLTSLETARPLQEFDAIGFTLPYELCYSNILTILELANIPFYTRERHNQHPLIIGGGACAMNPEPVADFFDAILLGDGEEAMLEIAAALAEAQHVDREEQLDILEKIDGIYIPSRFTVEYNGERIAALKRVDGREKTQIRRRIVANLDDTSHLKHPLVPNARIVHDRLGIEVARGCTRGCRFCQAGITYRPVRERQPEQIMELAREGIGNSGFEELALLSLSTGDYSCLDQTLAPLMDTFAQKYISVAMPSMRVGTLTPAVMEQIKRVRKTGFTLAPEAGSDRLRRVINKGITEEDLLSTCNDAFRLGWKLIKCYFMIGLPTETEEDISAIAQLVNKILTTGKATKDDFGQPLTKGGRPQVNVSVGTFVPKPHTPFQWQRQISVEESIARLELLRRNLPGKGNNLKYHNPKVSWLEGVFSRGDRRLAPLIVAAWKKGARLDGWTEHFQLGYWQEAGEELEMDLNSYLRARELDEILPWTHLATGVSEQFLKEELAKAGTEEYTPDCRYHSCQQCGLCDFKTIKPIVHNRSKNMPPAESLPQQKEPTSDLHIKYMVHYSRRGKICYLGHLEILQLLFRTLHRAKIPVHYSKGFHPSPKVSFGPALPVGTESLAEYFIMDLKKPLSSTEKTLQILNQTLPKGLAVTRIEGATGIPLKMMVDYRIQLPFALDEKQKQQIAKFLTTESFIIAKVRKKKSRELDIRPMISQLRQADENSLSLQMISESTVPGIKPVEAIEKILTLDHQQSQQLQVLKESWKRL